MKVIIDNLQNRINADENTHNLLIRAIEFSLENEGFETPSEISVLLVDNDAIKLLNKEHREIDKPTDVLSFPMLEIADGRLLTQTGDYDPDGNLLLLGDIVISLEMAKKQAEEYGHSYEREVAFLATHGIFHLLGYDHENEAQEKAMLEKQEAVLQEMQLLR